MNEESPARGIGIWPGRIRRVLGRTLRSATRPLRASAVSLDRPAFIWGNGQSGTFLLYDLLSLTGAFAFRSTTGSRKKGLARQMQRKPVEGISHWAGAGVRFERDGRWVFDKALTADDLAGINFNVVRRRYERLAEDWRWHDGPRLRVLDKYPDYSLMTEAIDRLFPDALHVFVLRDPRWILSSILARFKNADYEPEFRGYPSGFYGDILLPGYEALRHESLEVRHAWQIEQVLRAAFSAANRLGDRCIIARHEDLLADPARALGRVTGFLGVPAGDPPFDAIRRGRPVPPSDVPYVDHGLVPSGFLRYAEECGYDPALAGKIARRVAGERANG